MNDKQIAEMVDILYPFFVKKMEEDGSFKNNVKMKNAIVVKASSPEENVEVRLPFDTTSFSARNETGKALNEGDLVCIMYWIDLKNAVAIFKV